MTDHEIDAGAGFTVHRSLPDSVRLVNRARLLDGMARPRNRVTPVMATVAAVVIGLAGVVAWSASGAAPEPVGGAGPVNEMRVVPPEVQYGVDDHVSAESAARCAVAGWTPRWRAGTRGVEVVALGAGSSVRLCELTPTGVTLSSPVDPRGAVAATFRTAAGTVAGLVPPDVRLLAVMPAGTRTGQAVAYVRDGVFVAPNAVPASTSTVEVWGAGPHRLVSLPAETPARVDRQLPPGQLDPVTRVCLTDQQGPPVVAVDAWRSGAVWTSRSGDQVRTARLGTLLASCTISDDGVLTVVEDGRAPRPGPEVEANPLVFTTTRFVDFQWEDGASRSGTVAVTGLALDDRVASVELSRPVSRPVKANIVAGTFILPDVDLNEGTEQARKASVLTVRDIHGNVLATPSLPI